MACTVASMLTTTPRRRPSQAAVPLPITLRLPPGASSATTAATREVPTSNPTSSSAFFAITSRFQPVPGSLAGRLLVGRRHVGLPHGRDHLIAEAEIEPR